MQDRTPAQCRPPVKNFLCLILQQDPREKITAVTVHETPSEISPSIDVSNVVSIKSPKLYTHPLKKKKNNHCFSHLYCYLIFEPFSLPHSPYKHLSSHTLMRVMHGDSESQKLLNY